MSTRCRYLPRSVDYTKTDGASDSDTCSEWSEECTLD